MADDPMTVALGVARKALEGPDIPIGAALCIDGAVVAAAHNRIVSDRTLTSHAENLLLTGLGRRLFDAGRAKATITLFTTLEPCLMCLASAAHCRVARVVFACRDRRAGARAAVPPTEWYAGAWPTLEHDAANEPAAAELLLTFADRRPRWADFAAMLRETLAAPPG